MISLTSPIPMNWLKSNSLIIMARIYIVLFMAPKALPTNHYSFILYHSGTVRSVATAALGHTGLDSHDSASVHQTKLSCQQQKVRCIHTRQGGFPKETMTATGFQTTLRSTSCATACCWSTWIKWLGRPRNQHDTDTGSHLKWHRTTQVTPWSRLTKYWGDRHFQSECYWI